MPIKEGKLQIQQYYDKIKPTLVVRPIFYDVEKNKLIDLTPTETETNKPFSDILKRKK